MAEAMVNCETCGRYKDKSSTGWSWEECKYCYKGGNK